MACTSVPDERMTSYVDFPETRELTSRTLTLDSALFRYPYRVRVQDDKAVVFDLHGMEYFFHAFHYPGFHYLSSFNFNIYSITNVEFDEYFGFTDTEVKEMLSYYGIKEC